MELTLKIRLLLLALYEHKYNGKLYKLGDIFGKNGIKISQIEIEEIAKTLSEDDLIKTLTVEETIYGQITVDGVEFLEENNFFSSSSYLPQDRIKPLDRELMRNKLNKLHTTLLDSKLGNIVPKEILEKEMEELKALLNILGKHSWLQILKGKLIEMGEGQLNAQAIDQLLEIIEEKQSAKTPL